MTGSRGSHQFSDSWYIGFSSGRLTFGFILEQSIICHQVSLSPFVSQFPLEMRGSNEKHEQPFSWGGKHVRNREKSSWRLSRRIVVLFLATLFLFVSVQWLARATLLSKAATNIMSSISNYFWSAVTIPASRFPHMM